jgi:sirohydrochlorin ferrochelatase
VEQRIMATPLLLVVHGRTGGVIPEVYRQLARELEQRRQAPVALQALTAPLPAPGSDPALSDPRLTLVPLLLLPGNHARVDVPALARQLGLTPAVARAGAGVRRLPFLGAWPAWQSALATELAALRDPLASGEGSPSRPPLLLHHPLEGRLAPRYLEHLQRCLGCRCLAAPYSSQHSEALALAIDGPVLPLALAANRLTERLEPQLGRLQAAPLLERPRLRQQLVDQLAALP